MPRTPLGGSSNSEKLDALSYAQAAYNQHLHCLLSVTDVSKLADKQTCACGGLCCRNVNIELSEQGTPVRVLCPGGEYDVKVRSIIEAAAAGPAAVVGGDQPTQPTHHQQQGLHFGGLLIPAKQAADGAQQTRLTDGSLASIAAASSGQSFEDVSRLCPPSCR